MVKRASYRHGTECPQTEDARGSWKRAMVLGGKLAYPYRESESYKMLHMFCILELELGNFCYGKNRLKLYENRMLREKLRYKEDVTGS
jgi:hypothetical protein